MKRLLMIVPVLSLCLLATAPAWAAECEGVSYPDQIEVNGATLQLNGMGVREATIFQVNVYVAALYLENTSSDGAAIAASNETKRLILTFVRDVDVEDVTDAFAESFARNGGRSVSLQAQLATLNSWMESIREGETFAFTYVPGTGLQVQVKGSDKGVIEGEEFARIFFLIWLGEPPNGGLKTGLLGGECG